MQGFIPNELTNAVHATLRVANELSHGSRVYPYSESVKREEVRARRGPKPLQWLIERETFETAVAEQYTQLQNGVVRELIAGTGVGKTTRLPLVLARTHRVNGIVLMPHATYAMRTFSYVASRVQAEGGDVNVVLLRSMHVKTPPTSPVVYFTDADTFLGRLARTPTLIRDLGLDFIFLDESHSGTPGYTFFRYAVAANIVSGCKVFYGTATASADVSMESTKAIQKVNPKVLSIDNPRSATGNSPMHYTRIQDKTIVMLANDQEIDQWFHYYNDHDIPVYRCTMAGGDTVEMAADKFVTSHALCVLLVTGKFRTSVTLDVDTVIDGGYQTVVTTDFGERTVSLRRIPISEALRVQSMGRVNRFKPGRGFYADIEYNTQSNDDNDDNAFYVFLWAIVFNLKINEPSISMFNDLFSTPMTRVNAAHLLHCRVPPFLMVPYIGDEGFYRGWHNVGKFVLFQHGIDCYDEAPVDTSSWVEYNTGPVTYSSSPIVYKSMVRYPREWDVLPAYAWSAHQGEDVNIRMLRAASVISAAPTMRTAKPTNASRLSVNTIASHDTVGTLWTDGRTPKASVNDVTHNAPRVAPALRRDSVGSGLPAANKELALPGLPFIQSAYSVRDSLPAIKHIPVHTRNNSVEEIPRNPIDEWQRNATRDMVPGSAYLQRVNSESSDERHQIDLRSVNPVKYKQFKLYPMDPSAFTVFAQREAANIHDKDRVVKLLHGSVNIANLHGETTTRKDKQTAYFLSVLRVHNAAVVHSAQLAAHQNPGILSRLRIGFNGSMQTVDKDIDETAGLLKAFMIEGFFVGVDKRARRSQDSFSMYTPDYDYEEAKAKIMLSFGAQGVVNIIGKLVRLSRPVYHDDKYLANAWQMQDVVFTVQHPFEDRDFLPEWAKHVVEKPDDDDVIVFAAKTVTDSTIAMRDAVNNESVYAVTYDVAKEQAVVLGDYDVRVIGSTLYITTDLAKGASGALIVAVSDGAVLGIYVGYFGHIGDVQCSVVVPSAVLRKYIG